MAWARIDDRANGNAKLLALTDSAWRLWGCGLIYCQANLTDGFIPSHAVATFGLRARDRTKVVDELCRSQVPGKGPLWHRTEGGYQIHDYLDWNDCRDVILANRDWAARRRRLYANTDLLSLVRERDGSLCRYCGRKVNWSDKRGPLGATYDHVIARGPDTVENIVVACRGCNTSKGDRPLETCRMRLLPPPEPPRALPAQAVDQLESDLTDQLHDLPTDQMNPGQVLSAPTTTTTSTPQSEITDQSIDADFARFWEAYPRKVAKAAARAEWRRANPAGALTDAIIAGLERAKATRVWRTAMREPEMPHVPHPRTWLHQRRWEDEAPVAANGVPPGRSWMDECEQLHGGTCPSQHDHWWRKTRETDTDPGRSA